MPVHGGSELEAREGTMGTTAWTTFDPHGDLAATAAASSATIVSALRSDAWGATLDAYTAGSGSRPSVASPPPSPTTPGAT